MRILLSQSVRFARMARGSRTFGSAQPPEMNGKNSNQKLVEDQVNSLKKELKELKTMINNSTGGQKGPSQNSQTSNEDVLAAISALRQDTTAFQSKLHKSLTLANAIQNAEHNSFNYNIRNDSDEYDSTYLVRAILFAFQGGAGYIVDKEVLVEAYSYYGYEFEEQDVNDFYSRLADQIRDLIGVRPKMERGKDGRCTFRYP